MNTHLYPRLLGDIGGTRARFAWQDAAGAALTAFAVEPCASHTSLAAAIRQYLRTQQHAPPRAAAIGIANPVAGDAVRMTNNDWSFSIEALRRELRLDRLLVINDFAALALSLPTISVASLRQVGPGRADPSAALAVIGPGTGLGVSGLLAQGEHSVVIAGEGGHVTLATANEREAAVIGRLRLRFGHVSAERAVSGPGLVHLYDAVAALDGKPAAAPLAPRDVVERAQRGDDPAAVEALALFCRFLGSVAGDLALTLGARGGVYIGGGIVPRLGAAFDASDFRRRFEAKGRFAPYLTAIPTFVIDAEHSPALAGASRALDLQPG